MKFHEYIDKQKTSDKNFFCLITHVTIETKFNMI
jgi:hypothetical protein